MDETIEHDIDTRREVPRREEDETGQILREAAAEIAQGLLVVDADETVVYLNPQYRAMFGVAENDLEVCEGRPLGAVLSTLAQRGEYGDVDPEAQVAERVTAFKQRSRLSLDRPFGVGRYMHVDGSPLDGGGYVFTFTEITERVQERKRLDKLVQAKTRELHQVNRKLLDGIEYASMIQTGILPQPSFFETQIGDSFIIYRPSDMVGGDFYIGLETEHGVFLGLGDCTGHGIPGAMMTMMTASECRRAINEAGAHGPAAVLRAIDALVRSNLHQTEAKVGPDNGLEFILCLMQPDGVRMAGAGLDIFVQSGGTIDRVRGAKHGLGYGRQVTSAKKIEEAFYPADEIERIFMTSDGLLDQGGGEKGFGFGRRRMVEALQAGVDLSIEDQGRSLEGALEAYSRGHLQRDDLAVLGFEPYPSRTPRQIVPVDESAVRCVKALCAHDTVLMRYDGPFAQDVLEQQGRALRDALQARGETQRSVDSVFTAYVELAQNIRHYAETAGRTADERARFNAGIILISATSDGYSITAGNSLLRDHAAALQDRLVNVAGMDGAELKAAYRIVLRQDVSPDALGAGLGLMQMARMSSQPLDYALDDRDDETVFFTIRVCLSAASHG